MKLEIENCKCGGPGCTGKLLRLDGYLMDGIHDAETATTLQSAVNLHDELIEALCSIRRVIQGSDIEGIWLNHPELPEVTPGRLIEDVLAKVERKGK